MRADKEDGGNITRIEGDYHPERPGKVRNANLGEQIITRQPVPQGRATLCAQRKEELII